MHFCRTLVLFLTSQIWSFVGGTTSPCATSCVGEPDGYHHSCNGCNVYATCANGNLFDNRPCPANLFWDDSSNRCEATSTTCDFWGPWGAWSACSVTCGGGTQSRSRTCLGGTVGSGGCPGWTTESRSCNPQACPAWGSWGSWSACSLSCGTGTRSRSRNCVNGSPGDPGCSGSTTSSENCNTQPCPGPCVSSCSGRSDGYYQSCIACNIYVTCDHGVKVDSRPCPSSLVWDDSLKTCDWTSTTCTAE